MLGRLDIKGYDVRKRVYSPEGISPTLMTCGGGGWEVKILDLSKLRVRKLTPTEYGRLQAFPMQDWEQIVSDSQAYKQFGNAVTVSVVQAIAERLRGLLEDDSAEKTSCNTSIAGGQTLQMIVGEIVRKYAENVRHKPIGISLSENGDIRPYQPDKGKAGVSEIVKVAYEDNVSATVIASHMPWVYGPSTGFMPRMLTPEECGKLQAFPMDNWTQVVSDTQAYKQFGNAVTVSVITAIANSLRSCLEAATEGREESQQETAQEAVTATVVNFKSLSDYTEAELLAELMRRQVVNG